MVEFVTEPYSAMDREGHRSKAGRLEEPIIPIKELGQTVPETDPSGRMRNVVQTVQAAMRAGSGVIQLVMTAPHNSPIGGGFKSHGKEVRQAIKDVIAANNALFAGVEMPTSSLTNLSGINLQKATFSDEDQRKNLEEVKDAIKFVSEVAGGGGVDLVAFESPRTLAEKPEWYGDKWGSKIQTPVQDEIFLVDDRTQTIHRFPKDGLPSPPGEDPRAIWKWDDYVEHAKKKSKEEGKEISPLDLYKEAIFGRQTTMAKREVERRSLEIDEFNNQINQLEESLPNITNQKKKEEVETKLKRLRTVVAAETDYIHEQERTITEHEERKVHLKPIVDIAKQRATDGYAKAGLVAMNETHKQNLKKPIYVGPEIGWPEYWGSHPDEFIELVKGSREKMAKELENKGYTKSEAVKEAKQHIKGLFDTGHMGMWLQNFMPEEPDFDKRVKEFNKWYNEQVDKLIKADIIGSIQVVDSKSGAHAHLPAGQGVLPVVEAVKKFKKAGFTGFIVSEGHEEERAGEGRILLKTWEAFDARLTGSYGPPMQGTQTWGNAYNSSLQNSYAPKMMFGSYTPPFGEYKPWSEIPFE